MKVTRSKCFGTACETCDTRRHPDERSRRRWRCLRMALGSSDDAVLSLIDVRYVHEVLIDIVGQKTREGRIVAAQDHNVPLFWAPQSLSFEAGELLAGVSGL